MQPRQRDRPKVLDRAVWNTGDWKERTKGYAQKRRIGFFRISPETNKGFGACPVHDSNTDYFTNQTLLDALSDFPLLSLASPRNRAVVKELEEKALKGQFDEIFRQATGLYAENYHKAIDGVFDKAKPGNTQYAYSAQFKHNVSNLAAWKAHRMATDLVKLKEPDKIKQAIKKYNQWQAVEYNAITSRARTARQLLDFDTRKDIYPNLEWIRSRSANPREAHLQLVGLILPVNHPFWETNQPGNLYGCKCDWKQTDAPTSAVEPKGVTPSPGLDGNPINTGELITRRAGHFKVGDQKKVPAAILELPDNLAYLNFTTPNNIPIRAHIAHGTDELRRNFEIFTQFAKLDTNIKDCILLPKIDFGEKRFRQNFYPKGNKMLTSTKNADALISFKNGELWVADMKSFKSTKLRKRANEGANQADFIIIRMETNYHNTGFIIKTFDDMIKKGEIKGVVVMDINGDLIYRNA